MFLRSTLRLLWIFVMAWLALPALSHADMFDDARSAIQMASPVRDSTGFSVRGGMNLHTGQQGTRTLLRGSATIGGPCGAFNFAGSLREAIEEIPGIMGMVVDTLLESLPMLAICTMEPIACDILKHVQGLVNFLLQARFAQCHQIQAAMAYGGRRLRDGEVSRCLEEQVNGGVGISTALRQCSAPPTTLRGPHGRQVPQVNLIEDTMRTAGATPEMITLANTVLGEITLQAGTAGGLGASSSRPHGALYQRYEGHKATADGQLRAAVEEFRTTGTISEDTLRSISVPGQPMPRAVLDALASLQPDAGRYEAGVGQLSTAGAIAKLTWECHEIQNQLRDAIAGNVHLSDEERRTLEQSYAALQQELAQVREKADVRDKYLQPAMENLMREAQAVQAMATQAGLGAVSRKPLVAPYGQQNPTGYGQ